MTKHIPNVDRLVSDVIANWEESGSLQMLNLAKAYEHQRERIADLEDDLERLRPKDTAVAEVVFEASDGISDIKITSDGENCLEVSVDSTGGYHSETYALDEHQSADLARKLADWAGISVTVP